MKKLICLHGNPLNGQEFDPLVPELERLGYQAIIHKRPIKGCSKLEPLLQSINATIKVSGGGTFDLAAYSWGAYLALAYLRRFPENVTGVLLINPLLVDKKPVHFGLRMLLATPIIRSIALRLKRKKLASDYIIRTFSPEIPSEEVDKILFNDLSHAYVWRGALAYKKLMVEFPLPLSLPTLSIPIRVLFGDKDEVAPKLDQMQYLQTLNNLNFNTLPNTGHAIPWTHSSLVIEEIKKLG
jgi:pimeloyl-ACP methyl ester carboxylesterase